MVRRLRLVLRLTLAGVFIYAAYTKLRQPWLLFALSIDSYGLLPEWAVLTLARTLPWMELGLGSFLAFGLWTRHLSVVATTLLSAFFVVMLFSYFRGATIDCGCFGVGETLSAATLVRDGTLVMAGATLVWLCRHPSRRLYDEGTHDRGDA